MQKTSDLSQFTFTEENRKVRNDHLSELIESIRSCNLLEMRPITVNEKMEVIDGQHRLMAARHLGLPIYYKVEKNLDADHMIALNLSRQWNHADYLNHYVQRGFPEYRKFQEFVKSQQLRIPVALTLLMGNGHSVRRDFREGKFKFNQEFTQDQLTNCRTTQDVIKRSNGVSHYLESAKFWKAIVTLVSHPDFNLEKWLDNLKRFTTRFDMKATTADYLKLIMDVYNWRNPKKIHLNQDDIICDT